MSAPRHRPLSRVRTTAELYTLDAAPRLGFVQYQIGLARLSISLQVPRAARAALLVLSATDFPVDPETAHAYLTALRDPGLRTSDIIAAVDALSALAGIGDPEPSLRPSEG
jgi:hypothetical protein